MAEDGEHAGELEAGRPLTYRQNESEKVECVDEEEPFKSDITDLKVMLLPHSLQWCELV